MHGTRCTTRKTPRLLSIIGSVCACIGLIVTLASPAGAGIGNTLHDFTVSQPPAQSGSGQTTATQVTGEIGVCLFCHTPHNANPSRGLWNHRLPATTYRLYESSTLQAKLNQPTGSSRLCLSCHDGTLALGDLHKLPKGTQITSGPLRGSGSLGTDLSDDHPISFVYDMELANRTGQLADPASLRGPVKLDATGQMQCTSCHEPHEDKFEKFLVMDDRGGRLCTTCHRLDGWNDSSHATSEVIPRNTGNSPWSSRSFLTVADNACANCHQQHGAAHPEWLLIDLTVSERCFACHDGSVAAKDLRQSFASISSHPIVSTESLHRPGEIPLVMKRHVACSDCHQPHSVRDSPRRAAGDAPQDMPRQIDTLGTVDGIDASGGWLRQARWEYEVCYKCHGVIDQTTSVLTPQFQLTRQDNVTNVRLQFSTGNMSFHPVQSVGRDPTISGLEAGYTPSSVLACTDCHNSDSSLSGGARGPHGSMYEPILVREYQVVDPSMESFQSYALCYRCHDRSVLLSDSGGFPHQRHVVDDQASCSVCHDAHGSRQNPSLINFLLRGKTGNQVVTPSAVGQQIKYVSLGGGRGACSLTCHGKSHEETEYPVQAMPSGSMFRSPLRGAAPVPLAPSRANLRRLR